MISEMERYASFSTRESSATPALTTLKLTLAPRYTLIDLIEGWIFDMSFWGVDIDDKDMKYKKVLTCEQCYICRPNMITTW